MSNHQSGIQDYSEKNKNMWEKKMLEIDVEEMDGIVLQKITSRIDNCLGKMGGCYGSDLIFRIIGFFFQL